MSSGRTRNDRRGGGGNGDRRRGGDRGGRYRYEMFISYSFLTITKVTWKFLIMRAL